MASQAKLQSNHYDVLGLSPAASQDEIGGAFAAALSKLAAYPMAGKLHLYEAFGVLREPEKRKAYDRSIGLAPEPPAHATFVVPQEAGILFGVAAQGTDKSRPAVRAFDEPLRLPVEAELKPAPVEPVEPVVAQAPEPEVVPAAPVSRDATNEADLYQLVERIRADGRSEKRSLTISQKRPQDWRRFGIAAAALVVGAGILGGIVGVSGGGSPSPEDAIADAPLPTPSPYLSGTAPSRDFDKEAEAQVRAENEASAKRRLAAATPDDKINPLLIPPEIRDEAPKLSKVAPVAVPAVAETEAPTGAADPLAPQLEVASTGGTAQLPLPKATIARTIEKIGYPCGSVSSIDTVDAGGGVFKVSCSSGNAYRASPTNGRYRFKKWAGA